MAFNVGELAASLVREFLSRKGLKSVLAVLDEELPRTSDSISNRLSLAKCLHIERLMKKNKEVNNYRTMLEVIVHSLVIPIASSSKTPPTASCDPHSSKQPNTVVSPSVNFNPLRTAGTLNINPTATGKTSSTEASNMSSSTLITQRLHGASDGSKYIHSNPITKNSFDFSKNGPRLSGDFDDCKDRGSDAQFAHSTVESKVVSSIADSKSFQSRSRSIPTKSGDLLKSTSSATHNQMKDCPDHTTLQGRRTYITHSVGGGNGNRCPTSNKSKQMKSSKFYDPTELKTKHSQNKVCTLEGNDASTNMVLSPDGNSSGGVSQTTERRSRETTLHGLKSPVPPCDMDDLEKVQSTSGSLVCQDLKLEDFDLTMDMPTAIRDFPLTRQPLASNGHPISLETAKALRVLLFGTAKGPSFTAEWRRQNFFFCDLPGLEFGLIQHKGGPCGVLACVQAYLLKHLMFEGSQNSCNSSPKPTHKQRTKALVGALSEILWQAGCRKQAIVALPGHTTTPTTGHVSSSYRLDKITEKVVLFNLSTKEDLTAFLEDKLPLLQDDSSSSCIHFLLSVILSRGIDRVKSDMDEETSTLIGAHGYCTQEMVNLLLTGAATSNVFDGELQLDSGGKDKHILKGISQQSSIGYLSLMDHYNACMVGSHLKKPMYPIWIVYSESHYSVLFSHQQNLLNDWRLEKKFILYYYDGLGGQDDVITLLIDNTCCGDESHKSSETQRDGLVAPLEHCIKTKWTNARIEWSCDPLL